MNTGDSGANYLTIFAGKDIVQQQSQRTKLVVVNCDDEYGALGVQQTLCKLKTPLHECQPFAVPPTVIAVDVVVVVFPVPRSGVVRRVDVDAIHFARVQILQQLQRVVVVGLDQRVPRCIGPAVRHRVLRHQCWKNRFAELAHHHQLVQREFGRVGRCTRRTGLRALALHAPTPEALHPPQVLQRAATRAHQVALARPGLRARQQLGQMVLEHQAELFLSGGFGPLGGQALAQAGAADLCNQVVDSSHGVRAPPSSPPP